MPPETFKCRHPELGEGKWGHPSETAKPEEDYQKASQTNWNMPILLSKLGETPLNVIVQITFVCFLWDP